MRYRFSKYDSSSESEDIFRQLSNVFTQLLTQASGDVEKSLRWMELLGERYGFFDENFTPQDFRDRLEEQQIIEKKQDRFALTPIGEEKIRTDAFEEIFSSMKKDSMEGSHRIGLGGGGGELLTETRGFQFGDALADINFPRSIQNAIFRSRNDRFSFAEDDLEVFEKEHNTSCATVMLLDISHSMILYGEDRITPAKKVAMALDKFISIRYPKDSLSVGVFGDDAQMVKNSQLPYISVGPFHTNTKAALQMAQRVLSQKKHANKQIFMITDGKPSAIFENGRLYKNPFGLDPKIANQTVNEAVQCRKKGIVLTTFMITGDPTLRDFVEKLTIANKGKAYYSDLNNLGSFILSDYVKNRRKKV